MQKKWLPTGATLLHQPKATRQHKDSQQCSEHPEEPLSKHGLLRLARAALGFEHVEKMTRVGTALAVDAVEATVAELATVAASASAIDGAWLDLDSVDGRPPEPRGNGDVVSRRCPFGAIKARWA